MRNRRVDRDLRTVETRDGAATAELRWRLAHQMPRVPRAQQRQITHRLTRILREHPSDAVRTWAAYTLHFTPDGGVDARPALLAAARDDPRVAVRAQALESLGGLCSCGRTGPTVERVAAALHAPLTGDDPDLRFWALYATGQMERPELRAEVNALVGDDRLVAGLWTVGEEAQDVLVVLSGAPWPDRVPRGYPAP